MTNYLMVESHIAKIIQAAKQIDEAITVQPGVQNNDKTCVEQYFKFYSKLANQ